MASLESWTGGLEDRATYWRLKLTDFDAMRMDREQLAMVQDGLWLIERALAGKTDGPLKTPLLGLRIRS